MKTRHSSKISICFKSQSILFQNTCLYKENNIQHFMQKAVAGGRAKIFMNADKQNFNLIMVHYFLKESKWNKKMFNLLERIKMAYK